MSRGDDSFASDELDSTYFDAILEYETRLDRKEPVDVEELIRRFPAVESRLREYFRQRDQATRLLGATTGRRAPEFINLQSFGHYSVLELMDWGGNASIHRVEDTRFGRTAALKIPLKMWANDPHALRRLQREARLSGRLQHPHIIPIYDVGTTSTPDGDLPYFTMRLVVGRSLSDVLKERTDPLEDQFRFLMLFRQICQAMAYAHEQQILHRDLKPGNVMVGDFDDAYVMDWGYAKDLRTEQTATLSPRRSLEDLVRDLGDAADDLSRTVIRPVESESIGQEEDQILGTPSYLPPEIAQRRAAAADYRSDVFCLGGILCAILTGEPTYNSLDVLEVSRLAYSGDLRETWARLGRCGANPALIALARDCLAPDPNLRPQNARAVADRVSEYIHGQEQAKIEAERGLRQEAQARADAEAQSRVAAEARYVAERQSRRLTVVVSALLVMIVTGAAGGLWRSVEAARLARRAETAREVGRCLAEAGALRQVQEGLILTSLADLGAARGRWDQYLGFVEQAASTIKAGEATAEQLQAIEAARNHGQTHRDEVIRWQRLVQDVEAAAELTALSIDEYAPSRELADQAFQQAFDRFGLGSPDARDEFLLRARQIPLGLRERISEALDQWALAGTEYSRDRFELATALLENPPEWRAALVKESLTVEDLRVLVARADAEPGRFSAAFYLACGYRLARLGTQEEALALNRRARDRFRDEYALHLQAGAMNSVSDPVRLETAESAFRAALAVAPESPTALALLGYVLYRQGQFPQATAMLNAALERQAAYPWALVTLGRIELTITGDYEAAQTLFRRALDFFPRYPMAADGLALAYAMRGMSTKAMQVHPSLGIPAEQSAFHDLGQAMKALPAGRLQDAADSLERFLSSPVAQGGGTRALSPLMLLLRGDLEDAETVADQTLAAGSLSRFERTMLITSRGMVYAIEGRFLQAEGEFQQLAQEVPEYFLPHVGLVVLRFHRGYVAEARRMLEETKNGEWLPVPTMQGVLIWTLETHLKVADLLLGTAETYLDEPTFQGVRKRVLDSGGFYTFPVAELALARQRAGLAFAIYYEMMTTFPLTMLQTAPSSLAVLKNPTHRLNGVRAIGVLVAGRATDQHEFVASRFPDLNDLGRQWLRAELKSMKRVARTKNGRVRAKFWVHYCQKCPDLAGIRDAEFLEKMTPTDREQWAAVWQEIEQLRQELKQPVAAPK